MVTPRVRVFIQPHPSLCGRWLRTWIIELWRAHKNARGTREEGEDARVFPPLHACGGIFEPQMESVWQSEYECFLNAVEFSEAHCLLRVLDECFIVV